MTPDGGKWESLPKIGKDSGKSDVLQDLHRFPLCMFRLGLRQILKASQQLSATGNTARQCIELKEPAAERWTLTRMPFFRRRRQ